VDTILDAMFEHVQRSERGFQGKHHATASSGLIEQYESANAKTEIPVAEER
jgi:hypothetical protein